MKNIRLRITISGRVQGVWFRESTRRKATALGVFGWVKNRRDGTVEALVEGPEDQVKKLASWCHRGPPGAEVSRVQETPEKWQGEFSSFDILFW
jgi:acylphosphatase